MLEQPASSTPAALSPGLLASVAHAPSLGAPGCLCAREVGGVTELWWTEEGACPLAGQAVDLAKASPASRKPSPASPCTTAASLAAAPPAAPLRLRIDSFIPAELLLAALASLAPSLESLDYYEEALRDADYEARFADALAPAAPALRRLRIIYNPPLETLPIDSPPQPHPSQSPFYRLLPHFIRLTHISMTCTRYLARGAFAFLPPALSHLRIEVLRPCNGLSVPDALVAAFEDEENDVKGLKVLEVLDDEAEGWEGVEGEVEAAARRRGVAFVRTTEAEVEADAHPGEA